MNTIKKRDKWGYDGEYGPKYWHTLCPSYEISKIGKCQSPINIKTKDVKLNKDYKKTAFSKINYKKTAFDVTNSCNAIQFIPRTDENYIIFNNNKYTLIQAHIHIPSEHQYDSESSDTELHFVHQDENNNTVVVGVLGKISSNISFVNKTLTYALNVIKDTYLNEGDILPCGDMDLSEIFPKDSGIYVYTGSLTIPPTTEGVEWVLFDDYKYFSQEQIDILSHYYNNNNRPIQPLNNRVIQYLT